MQFFSSSVESVRYGAVIEIGSGSVLASIVKSDPAVHHPNIIWVKREYAINQTKSDTTQSAKGVMTALMNAVLLIESEGMKALKAAQPGAKITKMQVSITAPWSYTITKVINYSEEKEFTVTKTLLDTLMDTAQKKITEELKENELASDLGLTIMTRATTDILANDYKTAAPIGQTASTLTLTQVSAVAQAYLTDAIHELQTKVLPKVSLERYSFMLMYHCIIRDLHHQMTEYCLIDVTFEATEIGIVRDGILRYCTHTTEGISTVARKIAIALDIPLGEAYAFLKEPYHSTALETLSESRRHAIDDILREYQNAVTSLFHETGDSLSIPKVLFLHGGQQTEAFFMRHVEAAAKNATQSVHTTHLVSEELLTEHYSPSEKQAIMDQAPDTALLVAAQFFHKQHHCSDFIQV
jgi:cell division ATPase FtsA